MKATLKIGRDGLSAGFFAALDDLLSRHELVKVKFEDFKDQKKELAPQLAGLYEIVLHETPRARCVYRGE